MSAINSDFEGGYRMGRLAITLMNRLDAKEFIPRVYTSVYAFINIWVSPIIFFLNKCVVLRLTPHSLLPFDTIFQKEPFQAGLAKHLEGYDAGALSGDMEFAVSCLWNYGTCALNNCGENLQMLEKNTRLYTRRGIQCGQKMPAKALVM